MPKVMKYLERGCLQVSITDIIISHITSAAEDTADVAYAAAAATTTMLMQIQLVLKH